MNLYLPDTSCLIALLCDWHEHHHVTLKEMERRKTSGERIVLASPTIVESYAVLTRLPASFKMAEKDALRLLETNWKKTQTVSLNAQEYWALLKSAADRNIGGGQIYDGLIAACARKAKAKTI